MIPTSPLPSGLPPNTRVSKPSHRFGLRDWFATDRGIAFLTMGLFAFLGAWFGAIVYFACWLAERILTARSLVIALHVPDPSLDRPAVKVVFYRRSIVPPTTGPTTMADTNTPPTVLNFNDDTDRAASCLAALQRVLREHRYRLDVSEWLTFTTTKEPKDSHDLFESNWVDWMGADGKALDLHTIHDLARERLRQPC